MSHQCVFCAIVDRDEPASRVYEDDATLAFMNLRQANPGHVLVVPKLHVATVDALDPELASAIGRTLVKVSKAIKRAFAPEGLSVWQSNGEVAGQEIFHVHVHILPRRSGDGYLNIYPAQPPIERREALDALAAHLRPSFRQV